MEDITASKCESIQVSRDSEDGKKLLVPFVYEPLDLSTDAIRLLRITGIDGLGRIQCTLKHAKRSKDNYFALSYAWGDSKDKFTLVVDGKALKVRRNLHDFLQTYTKKYIHDLDDSEWKATNEALSDGRSVYAWHGLPENRDQSLLRDKSRLFEGRGSFEWNGVAFNKTWENFWIDAICLDQANLAERSHQVQQMYQIYRDAVQVISWLGTGGNIVSCVNYVEGHVDRAMWNYHYYLNCSYWTRVWVVQEIAAARDIVLMSTQGRRSWRKFWDTVQEDIALQNFRRSAAVITPAFKHCELKEYNFEALSLWDLVERFASFECSDVRDRIFGLFSLAAEKDRITVDYSMTPTELAMMIASSCIPRQNQLINLNGFEVLTRVLKVDVKSLISYISNSQSDLYQYVTMHTQDPGVLRSIAEQMPLSCSACNTGIPTLETDKARIAAVICLRNDVAPVHILRVHSCARHDPDPQEEAFWIGPIQSPYDNNRVLRFIEATSPRKRIEQTPKTY